MLIALNTLKCRITWKVVVRSYRWDPFVLMESLQSPPSSITNLSPWIWTFTLSHATFIASFLCYCPLGGPHLLLQIKSLLDTPSIPLQHNTHFIQTNTQINNVFLSFTFSGRPMFNYTVLSQHCKRMPPTRFAIIST